LQAYSLIEFELVKVFYLKAMPVPSPEEESIKLRLEVLRNCWQGTYHVKLFRLETYDVQPSYLRTFKRKKEVWAKEILISDEHSDWEEICENSLDGAVEEVVKRLAR